MKWKHVFDATKLDLNDCADFYFLCEIAKSTNYKFFLLSNGEVKFYCENKLFSTGLTVDDLI